MPNPSDSQRLETIVGVETKFTGEIESKGTVRIDGVFEGKIYGTALKIAIILQATPLVIFFSTA